MKNKTFTIAVLLIVAITILGFATKPVETNKYEYMQISQQGKNIYTSTSKGFSKTKGESEDGMDVSLLMKTAENYQEAGWEVINLTTIMQNSYYAHTLLLRKPK